MAAKKSATLLNRGGSVVFTGGGSATSSGNNPVEPQAAEAPQTIINHPEFFFDNTLVAIQIENVLFNVHKYQLSKSEVFSDMFKLPKPTNGEPEEGSSPKHPIVIEGVAASDFTALLRVLYARQAYTSLYHDYDCRINPTPGHNSHFSSNQPAPEASLIIPAFRLANMFKFVELRTYLLPLAEKNLDDVDKIVFAREFKIKEWLAPAHTRLCQRDDPLNTEEARKLGVDSVLLIWRMREQHRNQSSGSSFTVNQNYCYSCAGLTYTGSGTCTNCRGSYGSGYLRCNGPGRVGSNRTSTTNNAAIEAGVKKWVEDGCALNSGDPSRPADSTDDGTGGLMWISV